METIPKMSEGDKLMITSERVDHDKISKEIIGEYNNRVRRYKEGINDPEFTGLVDKISEDGLTKVGMGIGGFFAREKELREGTLLQEVSKRESADDASSYEEGLNNMQQSSNPNYAAGLGESILAVKDTAEQRRKVDQEESSKQGSAEDVLPYGEGLNEQMLKRQEIDVARKNFQDIMDRNDKANIDFETTGELEKTKQGIGKLDATQEEIRRSISQEVSEVDDNKGAGERIREESYQGSSSQENSSVSEEQRRKIQKKIDDNKLANEGFYVDATSEELSRTKQGIGKLDATQEGIRREISQESSKQGSAEDILPYAEGLNQQIRVGMESKKGDQEITKKEVTEQKGSADDVSSYEVGLTEQMLEKKDFEDRVNSRIMELTGKLPYLVEPALRQRIAENVRAEIEAEKQDVSSVMKSSDEFPLAEIISDPESNYHNLWQQTFLEFMKDHKEEDARKLTNESIGETFEEHKKLFVVDDDADAEITTSELVEPNVENLTNPVISIDDEGEKVDEDNKEAESTSTDGHVMNAVKNLWKPFGPVAAKLGRFTGAVGGILGAMLTKTDPVKGAKLGILAARGLKTSVNMGIRLRNSEGLKDAVLGIKEDAIDNIQNAYSNVKLSIKDFLSKKDYEKDYEGWDNLQIVANRLVIGGSLAGGAVVGATVATIMKVSNPILSVITGPLTMDVASFAPRALVGMSELIIKANKNTITGKESRLKSFLFGPEGKRGKLARDAFSAMAASAAVTAGAVKAFGLEERATGVLMSFKRNTVDSWFDKVKGIFDPKKDYDISNNLSEVQDRNIESIQEDKVLQREAQDEGSRVKAEEGSRVKAEEGSRVKAEKDLHDEQRARRSVSKNRLEGADLNTETINWGDIPVDGEVNVSMAGGERVPFEYHVGSDAVEIDMVSSKDQFFGVTSPLQALQNIVRQTTGATIGDMQERIDRFAAAINSASHGAEGLSPESIKSIFGQDNLNFLGDMAKANGFPTVTEFMNALNENNAGAFQNKLVIPKSAISALMSPIN